MSRLIVVNLVELDKGSPVTPSVSNLIGIFVESETRGELVFSVKSIDLKPRLEKLNKPKLSSVLDLGFVWGKTVYQPFSYAEVKERHIDNIRITARRLA